MNTAQTGYLALGPVAGTSMTAAGDMVISEFGDRLHLPALPQRGLGSDAVGYTAALLESLSVDRGARRWQLSARPQRWWWFLRDLRERDTDVLEETWQYPGAEITVHVMGPVSLASQIELADGHRVLSDRSALFDLADALAVGVENFRASITRRFSVATRVQIDEPYLSACVRGEVPGATDYHQIAPLGAEDAATLLQRCAGGRIDALNLSDADHAPLARTIGYCSGAQGDGVAEIIVDQRNLRSSDNLDGFAELIDSGMRVGLATVPATMVWDDRSENPRSLAISIARLLDIVGINRQDGARLLDICPQPGLPGQNIVECARTYRLSALVARMLVDDLGDL
ncbi:uroporphyrinogen decarboxylase/cobalamine-independent methonine synthase family protein [Corynebacterium sp. MNWGS58]|uniref:hypothetical protein n=1 Tax=Corynebacterium sp. 102791.4 TaxID=3104612 RepID=UPI00351394A2